MVDISDVFIIEGGKVSVEGFAFAFFFLFFFFIFHGVTFNAFSSSREVLTGSSSKAESK